MKKLVTPKLFSLILFFLLIISYKLLLAGGKFFDIESAHQKASVPFQLINNFIVIDVLVNNHPQKFIVDTGFATPILFEAHNHPNLKVESKNVRFSGAGQGEPVLGNWAMNVDIKLPGIYCDKVAVIALQRDDLPIDTHFKIDGAIGFQLFISLVVHIDYQSLQMHFYRPEQFEPSKDFSSASLEVDYTKPYIHLKYQNGNHQDSARLLLDLGANLTMMILKESPWAKKAITTKKKSVIGQGLAGEIRGQTALLPDLSFADITLKDTPIYLVDSRNYGLTGDLKNRQGSIGNKFLKDFEVIINYVDGKIYLKPQNDKPTLMAHK